MKRRHRVAAEWVPEEPPKWAACRLDRFGGWYCALFLAPRGSTGRNLTAQEIEDRVFARWGSLLRRFAE